MDSWILGTTDVLFSTDYQVTAVTVVPSLLARIDAADFRRMMDEDTNFSRRVREQDSREIVELRLRVAELMTVPAVERLLRLLWNLASFTSSATPDVGTQFKLPLQMSEVAQALGVAPQTLSKLFKSLVTDKAITRRGRRTTLLRRPADE
jgi:CRP-like cAMP-binding protein